MSAEDNEPAQSQDFELQLTPLVRRNGLQGTLYSEKPDLTSPVSAVLVVNQDHSPTFSGTLARQREQLSKELNQSASENGKGLSHQISSNQTFTSDENRKLKTIIDNILGIQNQNKKWFKFQEMIEEKSLEFLDPMPEYVEGIFFVRFNSWTNILRCRRPFQNSRICVYDARSFYLFDHQSRFRTLVVKLTESSEFQHLTLSIILLTTATLIIYNYEDPNSVTIYNKLLDQINTYSSCFYFLEFVLQLVAKGVFLHPNSYFRDGWNWLDFMVVFAGLTEMTNIPNLPIKGFRAFRVLRPLKSIRQFPRLRKLISGLLSSIPQLMHALLFMLFIFLQFSIFGSEQFGGANYNRCRLPGGVVNGVWPIDFSQPNLCSKIGYGYACKGHTVCGSPLDVGLKYQNDDFQALSQSFNDYGISNFNNPINSILTIFQCVTLEGWSSLMFNLIDLQSGAIVVLFFTFTVILGAFFLIHVILAVVGHSLQQNDLMETSEVNLEKEKLAVSLKRREAQLQLNQREQFQEQIREQNQSQQQADLPDQTIQKQNDKDSKLPDAVTQGNEQPDVDPFVPVTERNLLAETEQAPEEAAFQDVNSQMKPNSENSRQGKTGRVIPEEEIETISLQTAPTKTRSNTLLPERTQNNRIYRFFYKVCISFYFTIVMTLIIVANSFVMALDRYPQPQSSTRLISHLNQFFSWIFTCEMLIKLTGLGIREYVRDSFNIFDALIVIMSVVDNILFYSIGNSASGGGVIILRSIRLLRVFKLARNWKSLRILIGKIVDTLPNIASFAFLLLIFQVVFVILGLQFFSGTVYINKNDKIVKKEQGDPPLNNFENLFNATTTVFAIMMTDNWNQMMYQYYRKLGVAAQIYFIGTVVILSIILLNLFLALFLENFENPTQKSSDDDEDMSGLTQFKEKLCFCLRYICNRVPPRIEKKFTLLSKLSQFEQYLTNQDDQTDQDESGEYVMQKSLRQLTTIHNFEKDVCHDWKLLETQEKTEQRRRLLSIAQLVKNETVHEIIKAQKKKDIIATGTSLWLLTPQNWLRRLCLYVYNLAHFDDVSNFMVIFSTILLAIDNPLDDPLSTKQFVLAILDYITTAVFSFESFVKIVTLGLIFNGKQSYFREPWNFLDFFVVLVSLFSYLPLGFDMQFYKSMRLLRILRPLRMIQRNQGLKIAIKSLINVLPGVVNLLMISGINLCLLAVLGINLFKGKFYTCNMANSPEQRHHLIKNMWDCQDYGGEWINADTNFDNFFSAWSSVYQIMSTEAWYSISTLAQQSTEVFQMPSPMASPVSFIYFVVVIFIQALFMGNLFIGAVITTFGAEKEKLTHNAHLTILEYEYLDICIKCFQLKPVKVFNQKQCLRKICYFITDSAIFQNFILGCIAANTLLLSCTWYGQSQQIQDRIEIFNLVFSIVYTLEFILKLIAFHADYFRDGWNQLDFFIVICVILGYAIKYLVNSNYLVGLAVIRVFRVVRLLKLIRQLTLLKRCFQTFIDSIPEILNIGSLLFLFLFMFVILGMNLFSDVRLQQSLNENFNFQSFSTAFLTLFIACTGENWPLIMADLSRQRSISFNCQYSQSYDDVQKHGINGCGGSLGQLFFPIFNTFMTFVMLNLFSAVILEGFRRELLDEQQKIRYGTLEMFQKLWKKYDPSATGMIQINQLQLLVLDFVDEEIKITDKIPVKKQKVSDEIFFNFRHKKLLTLSAKWRRKEDDGSAEYFNLEKSAFFQKQLQNHLLKFIGELQIPSYNRFQNFNFYDVLISFINFSFTQRQKYEHFQRKNLIKKLRETKQELSKLDAIELFSKDFFKLSRPERQRLVELETENFINIIHRIEKKGQRKEISILKVGIMQELRRRHVQKNKESLDDLDGQVVSSKLLIAAQTISVFVANWREKNRLRKLKVSFLSSQFRSCIKSQASVPRISDQRSIVLSGKTTSRPITVKQSSNKSLLSSQPARISSHHNFQAQQEEQRATSDILESDKVLTSSPGKISSDQPIDRYQIIDQQVIDLLNAQAQKEAKIQRNLVLPITETSVPDNRSSTFSFTQASAIKQKNIPTKQKTIQFFEPVKVENSPQAKKMVQNTPQQHYKSSQFYPSSQITSIKFKNSGNLSLSPDLKLADRRLTGAVKASTLQIYANKKQPNKLTQQQLHKAILKKMNHKPWKRFELEVIESDNEDQTEPITLPQINQRMKTPQRAQSRNAIYEVYVHSLRSKSNQEISRKLPKQKSDRSEMSESVSGSEHTFNERSVTFQRSPSLGAKKASNLKGGSPIFR